MSESITDKLDKEIADLEAVAYGVTPESTVSKDPEGEPVESLVGDASATLTDPVTDEPMPTTIDPFATDEQTEQTPPVKKERVSWKKRYVNLKQFHDSSRQQDRKRISELLSENTKLQREVIALKSEVQRLSLAKPTSVADLASSEELAVLGEEGVSSIDKLTKKAIESATAPLRAEVDAMRQKQLLVQQNESEALAQESQDVFLSRLAELVPDYDEIDLDPKFGEYLKQPDPASGRLRHDLFKQAEINGDVARVAYFFTKFKESSNPARAKLEQKVTPVGSQGSPYETSTPNSGEVELMKMSDYSHFMNDLTKGKYAGKQQLADQIEARFDLAIKEGRLMNS